MTVELKTNSRMGHVAPSETFGAGLQTLSRRSGAEA